MGGKAKLGQWQQAQIDSRAGKLRRDFEYARQQHPQTLGAESLRGIFEKEVERIPEPYRQAVIEVFLAQRTARQQADTMIRHHNARKFLAENYSSIVSALGELVETTVVVDQTPTTTSIADEYDERDQVALAGFCDMVQRHGLMDEIKAEHGRSLSESHGDIAQRQEADPEHYLFRLLNEERATRLESLTPEDKVTIQDRLRSEDDYRATDAAMAVGLTDSQARVHRHRKKKLR